MKIYHCRLFGAVLLACLVNIITAKGLLAECTTPAIGTGTGVLGDTKNGINTCKEQGALGDLVPYCSISPADCWRYYYLYDVTRSGITTETYSGYTGTASEKGMKDYYNGNAYDPNGNGDNIWSHPTQTAAVDAHVYAGKTYDYYKSTFSRTSFDGKGGKMFSVVDGANGFGADWNGSVVSYDAANGVYVSSAGAIDVAGHEWSHGLADYPTNTAARPEGGLYWSDEAWTLGEAFADWMGISVKHANRTNWTLDDWKFCRDIAVEFSGRRNLADPPDPTVRCVSPDYYHGNLWCPWGTQQCPAEPGDPKLDKRCNDYHTNAGVPNKMFYLLSEGGTHPFSGVTVQGVGIGNAAKIAYRAEDLYWTPNPGPGETTGWTVNPYFAHVLLGMINAATDLYGANSNEIRQAKLAWAAVGVGYTLNAAKSGAGNGTTTATSAFMPAGQLKNVYPPGDVVTLTAAPDACSTFAAWSGCDSVSGNTCTKNLPQDFSEDPVTGELITSATVTASFNVLPRPVTSFTANPETGYAPFEASFTNTTSGVVDSWSWSFGDGTTSSAQTPPLHIFRSATNYAVNLTASNSCGSTLYSKTITGLACPDGPARIGGSYYSSLTTAIGAAASGATILSQAVDRNESITINNSLTLDGGYLCDYSSNPSATHLVGNMTIGSGSFAVTIGNYVIN